MQRPAGRPAPAAPLPVVPRPTTLTAEEEERAAALEAAIVAGEQAAEQTRRARQERSSVVDAPRAYSSLAIVAGNEYAWDVRVAERAGLDGAARVERAPEPRCDIGLRPLSGAEEQGITSDGSAVFCSIETRS